MRATFRSWAQMWEGRAAAEQVEVAFHRPDSFFYAQRNLRRAVFEFLATVCGALGEDD